jgi:hypothetical protein
MPAVGDLANPLLDLARNRTAPDVAEVGYYRSELEGGIVVELSGSEKAGFYRYTFPEQAQKAVVVDVSHVLPSFRGFGWGQEYSGGGFEHTQVTAYTTMAGTSLQTGRFTFVATSTNRSPANEPSLAMVPLYTPPTTRPQHVGYTDKAESLSSTLLACHLASAFHSFQPIKPAAT